MEETIFSSPSRDGKIMKMEIKQKNAVIRKRKVKTWTPEEDQRLIALHQEYPKKWGIVASMMHDRNENQCLHRFRRLSQLGGQKKIWSAEEDASILSLIKKVGKNWKILSQIIGTKTGKQIRQRFINKLDPRIKTQQWTDEQDKIILKYYSQLGSKWSQISKKLPGRPQNKIKNRFYSFIQKNYDFKCTVINQNPKAQKQKSKFSQSRQINWSAPFKELSLNCTIQKVEQKPYQIANNDEQVYCKNQFPSIRQLNEEQRNKNYIQDSNFNIGHKFYIKSLIKMDEQISIVDCRYKSIRDLVSKGDIDQQNDLFYLSH